ncbi:MAG: hypothetical protein RG740_05635 [Acholeplasmataceae bacterium]|nr:hypothetical protein [Acholeplasmataceae bacterium]
MPKQANTAYIKFEQFDKYEMDPKQNRPNVKKPFYLDLNIPKDIKPVVIQSTKKGHSLLLIPGINDVFEVKGSTEAIITKIEMEIDNQPEKGNK